MSNQLVFSRTAATTGATSFDMAQLPQQTKAAPGRSLVSAEPLSDPLLASRARNAVAFSALRKLSRNLLSDSGHRRVVSHRLKPSELPSGPDFVIVRTFGTHGGLLMVGMMLTLYR